MNTEAELRHAVIDRLIAASLRDVVPAREASLEHWRSIDANPATDQQAAAQPAVKAGPNN